MHNVPEHQLPQWVPFHVLNCFGHVIYVSQTSTYQNIAKLLTHPSTVSECISFSDFQSSSNILWTYIWKREQRGIMMVGYWLRNKLWPAHSLMGDLSSIPGQVILKTQKMVLDAISLITQYYKVWIKGKWSNPSKIVVPSLTPRCSSYWKREPLGALEYSWLTYLLTIYIYQTLFHEQDETQGQFLSRVKLIQRFPSPRLVIILRFKSPVCSTIYT